ncbi:zinc finger CCCH domain-containing protein 14-like isoform X2 [Eriocheir sinensis]|uniref:zinc finger CCCH domain-containing protein 14-like isoform X2 n=1 Tax=Eriocheir sinensis TaxID=95602 RepID=UPI0021CAD6CB|nr:zinc finger CCCH domain-containing protein 14-like isoform X2 [Eriocheir sinensis]
MEGVASEVSLKIRSAIKAKLVELGTYVDEELPDYIMVLVANKKTKDQMDDDLSLFLGHNTERFTSWLHHVLQKLNAAALLQGTAASAETGRKQVVAPQEDIKKKEIEEEKRREKEEEKKREREEEKKRLKAEETKKLKEEEKRKAKEKEKVERKRKSSERKNEKKEKKVRKSESPPAPEKLVKERRLVSEMAKQTKPKEPVKEKEKEKSKVPAVASSEKTVLAAAEVAPAESSLDVSLRKIKPLVRGKISSADIFRAESQAEQKKDEEEEELEEDLLVLRADVDDLGLELEDEPVPRRSKQEHPHRAIQLKPEGREANRSEPKVTLKMEGREKADHREKIDHREKGKTKPDPPAPRISAKERLGGIVPPKANTSREKPSVLDRLGGSAGGKHIISLREESGSSARSESSSAPYSQGVARAVSSAITSAQRSVCVLPPSNSSGKKLEARVRPLMSRQVESSHGGASRGVSEVTSAGSEAHTREGVGRLSSGRVVSAVGAVLKRPHAKSDSEEEEEYDPKKPGLSGVASKVEVTPRPRRPRAIQANTALILRAMADAHKSVNRPSRHSREREKTEKQKSRKKHKGELFSRSYREREDASREKVTSEPHSNVQEPVRIRKIAITVPNATHKESEKQVKPKKEKVKDEEEVEVEVSVAMRQDLPEEPMETAKKEPEEEALEMEEDKAQVSDNEYNMEEVEEVEEEEEEVVDEGIEEDQPPVQHPLPPPVLPSRENTKFIVTLEGVDSEVFPEKEEPLGIRSRLGARPLPSDTDDQVEEYIEEVEEWEEEEEMSEEMETSSELPVGGAVTGVKARLKAAATPAIPLQPGGSKERCKYWPLCKAGEACVYHHPTVTCKSFPACKFGDKCLFIHPNCLYDGACTRIGCPYTHASSRNFAMVSAASTQKHKPTAPTRTSQIKCKFFPKCTNLSCPFLHPKACYYGASCKTPNCSFTHPAVPMGAKLKWVAPKAPGTQPAAPATPSTDSKEVGKKEETLVNK